MNADQSTISTSTDLNITPEVEQAFDQWVSHDTWRQPEATDFERFQEFAKSFREANEGLWDAVTLKGFAYERLSQMNTDWTKEVVETTVDEYFRNDDHTA